jgi:hypothetical protein
LKKRPVTHRPLFRVKTTLASRNPLRKFHSSRQMIICGLW